MKRQVLVVTVSLALFLSVAGVHPDAPAADPDEINAWQLIQYFGDEDYADLYWYYQWGVSTGIGFGCGFIGLGVGTLNPFAGLFASVGCEAGLMA
jgi:hypothetical protein